MSPSVSRESRGAVAGRLAALRALMAEQGLDVYLVPSADEHLNEYQAASSLRRQAISGFSGSAGDAAILAGEAHLFVDSRYHLQAERQVDPALFTVHKLGLAGELELPEWLTALETQRGALRVGYDPFQLSLRAREKLAGALRKEASRAVSVQGNLVDRVWLDRPSAPGRAVYRLPDDLAGETVPDKLGRVRAAMEEAGAGALVLTRLDEVAWLTNLRGSDIPYNPVFDAYLLLERARAACFTDNLAALEVREALAPWIAFEPAARFPAALEALGAQGTTIWLDPNSTTEGTRLLAGKAPLLTTEHNPVVRFKAVKNPVEIEASRRAHVRTGCAKVRSFALLSAWLKEGRAVSEAAYAEALSREYAREEGFADLSFTTIAAFGANGAIVHYGTPDPECLLEPAGLLLVDSGAQVLGATTDDTRTIALGEPDEVQRRHFTSVLRGHIRLAMQIFPEGTTGQMLDALARSALWNDGLDYGHGTGHGVGAFLNVHEGPQNISPRGTVPLEPGMIVSNEPGYYRAGWGGIRCENLYVVEEALGLAPHAAGRRWLRFSPLTLIPFDRALIDWSRLTPEEQGWLADYHAFVERTIGPLLDEPTRYWLREACRVPEA